MCNDGCASADDSVCYSPAVSNAAQGRIGRALAFLGLRSLGFKGKWAGLATLIGLVGGLAAVGFDWMLSAMHVHAFRRATGTDAEGLGGGEGSVWILLLILPLGGLVVGYLGSDQDVG